jgi:putative mRNA 3-end processing factor
VTLELAYILLRDSIKLQKMQGLPPEFLSEDIKRMQQLEMFLEFGDKEHFTATSIEVFNAGHIPGSAAILLETKNKRILYTGDIKFSDTRLMKGAHSKYKNIDVLISESTYSYMNHPPRKELEDRLRQIVQETLYNNGIAIIPAFAVGRTQELLMILADLGFPIYIDGMGISATERILMYPEYLKDAKGLKKAFGEAHTIKKAHERDQILSDPCIIITTAGMLNGGPVGHYIKKLHNRTDCSLIFSGYQVKGTAGRTLMDTGVYTNGDLSVKPKMHMEFLDFSAHTDHDHLLEFYEKVNPGKIVLIHGEKANEFAHELTEKGFDAVAPRNGERISA